MERASSGNNADINPHLGPGGSLTNGAGAVLLSSAVERATAAAVAGRGSEEKMEPFNIDVPVFLDRTFRMIESVSSKSNNIACWSEAGDSFIIKQARDKMRG